MRWVRGDESFQHGELGGLCSEEAVTGRADKDLFIRARNTKDSKN